MTRPLDRRERVLLRLPSWLGDLVQAEPVVRALASWLETPPAVAAPEGLLPVLQGCFPAVRRIPHRGRAPGSAEWRGHDVAVLLPGSFRSAWTAWRAGIPRRVGWARDGRTLLLTDALRPPLERGRTPLGLGRPGRGRRILPRPFGASCVELLGLLGVGVADTRPRLVVTDEARASAARRLSAVGLGPGDDHLLANTGARPGSAKALPPARWSEVLDLLAERIDLPVVLVCGPGEEGSLEEVRRTVHRARALASTDPPVGLPELAALCAGARLFLTADSGPRHVASAVGARVVCALGPSDPRHSADHLRDVRLARRVVPCGPCHLERCPLPGDRHHACMRELDPHLFVDRALSLVE